MVFPTSAGGLFSQGAFQIDPNATPEQLARKRELLAAMMPTYGRARYVGEGVGQLATGIASGRKNKALDKFEGEKAKEASNLFGSVMGGGGPMSILGMAPDAPMGTPFNAPQGAMPELTGPQQIGNDAMAAIGQPPRNGAGGMDFSSVEQQYGLPEGYLTRTAQIESGMNPRAQNPNSSAGGMFQFIDSTAKQYGLADRFDPAQATDAAARLARDNAAQLRRVLGREPTAAELYLAHQQGGGGASKILSNPNARAVDVLGRDAVRLNGGNDNMTTGEFAQKWLGKFGGGGSFAPGPGTEVAQSGPAMSDLMQAAQNPWLSPQQRAMVTAEIQRQQGAQQSQQERMGRREDFTWQQQQRQQDPAYLMDLERQRIELEQLQNPQNPQPGFMVLSPQEVQQLGLPPGAYQRGADGKIAPIGGGGVTVNNNMGEDKFGEAFAKGDADMLGAVSSSGIAAQRNMARIDQLGTLLESSPSGFAGILAQRAGEFGINTEGLSDIQATQALINSLVPEQRQPGSGPMSDADLELFKQSLPRIINQPGGNQAILGTMRGIAQYDAEGAAIVQRLRSGEIDRAQAFAELQGRENPLAQMATPSQQSAPPDGGLGGRVPVTPEPVAPPAGAWTGPSADQVRQMDTMSITAMLSAYPDISVIPDDVLEAIIEKSTR